MFDQVGEILRETAAVAVMPRFCTLKPNEIRMKGLNEPVTCADVEAEALIRRQLLSILPHARVVGEEACELNPALLQDLCEGTVWIIDPIDGTANFAAGRPPFAMMVALLEQGELVGSWILDPVNDSLAVAELGAGAWIGGKRLTENAVPSTLAHLRGIVSEAFASARDLQVIERLRLGVGLVQHTARCAGHEYPLVAAGKQHFILYWRTLVWDHAPGVLLLTEAGGSATYLDGSSYNPCRLRSGLLLANAGETCRMLLDLLVP